MVDSDPELDEPNQTVRESTAGETAQGTRDLMALFAQMLRQAARDEPARAPAPAAIIKLRMPYFDGNTDLEIFIEQFEAVARAGHWDETVHCLLYTSPSPRDQRGSRMPSSA